jgi:hypothetical protein
MQAQRLSLVFGPCSVPNMALLASFRKRHLAVTDHRVVVVGTTPVVADIIVFPATRVFLLCVGFVWSRQWLLVPEDYGIILGPQFGTSDVDRDWGRSIMLREVASKVAASS